VIKLKKAGINAAITLAMPVAVYIIFVVLTRAIPGSIPFGSVGMLLAILQNSVLGILVAMALCVNMPTFRIDLSAGAVVILTSIISASLTINYDLHIMTMLLISIVTATALSMITALTYIFLRIPMIVVSLGLVVVYEALTGIVFGGYGVVALGANTRLLGWQPWAFIVAIIAMIIFHFLTEHTRFSYSTRLLSGGQAMAVKMGVKENTNVLKAFAIAGFFLGLAAMIYVSNFGFIEVASGMSSGTVIFEALLPVLMGMMLARFSCNAIGIAVSVVTLKTFSYGLFCLGYNATVQNVVSGTFVLLLVLFMRGVAARQQKKRIVARAERLAGA